MSTNKNPIKDPVYSITGLECPVNPVKCPIPHAKIRLFRVYTKGFINILRKGFFKIMKEYILTIKNYWQVSKSLFLPK